MPACPVAVTLADLVDKHLYQVAERAPVRQGGEGSHNDVCQSREGSAKRKELKGQSWRSKRTSPGSAWVFAHAAFDSSKCNAAFARSDFCRSPPVSPPLPPPAAPAQ